MKKKIIAAIIALEIFVIGYLLGIKTIFTSPVWLDYDNREICIEMFGHVWTWGA